MERLSGYPYVKIQFSKEGHVFSAQEVKGLEDLLAGGQVSDLLVLAHGWNDDMAEARDLYKRLVTEFSRVVQAAGHVNRRFGVLGVLWPSKKFADEELTPGSGAAAGVGTAYDPADLAIQLDKLKGFFDGRQANKLLEKAKTAAREMASPANAQAPEDFVNYMTQLLTSGIKSQVDGQEPEESRPELEVINAAELLASLEHAGASPRVMDGGGAAAFHPAVPEGADGGAAGLGAFIGNTLLGARNLLNFVTYYQMKERAGKVGVFGLYPVLAQVRQQFPLVKLHLVGHSFGARLLTAAVAGPDAQASLKVDTLTLLQAAFSHYSLAEKYDGKRNGFFRRVVTDKKVNGPILISFSQHDKAVGLAYAIASRIANQVAAAIGGPTDIYGGMGRNGAQKTPEAVNGNKLESSNRYDFQKGRIYNLNGDSCITGHSDICHHEIARALLAAISRDS
jgi:hypothetical protein